MKPASRASRPSWQASERFVPRPELVACAAVVLSMLLVEVGQNSHLAQVSLEIDHTRKQLVQSEAQLAYARAAADHRSTRAELMQLGGELGLAPTRREQVWKLPSEYLADDRTAPGEDRSSPLIALAERVSGALVPDATARGRVTR